ncbi:MAG: LPS-assembly protein LptD [Bacteroidales bacterium]|nr:LPS-assembly protein LptD [Bacteroidales bacterium]
MSIRKPYIFRYLALLALFLLAGNKPIIAQDTIRKARQTLDTMTNTHGNSGNKPSSLLPLSPNAVKEIVSYKAIDSVAIELDTKKAFLYHEGEIDFQDMNLKADAVEVDFDRQQIHASGTVDENGKYQGRPVFKQGESEYNADTMTYNYKSEKGIIYGVITQEGDGYLHGNKIKKVNDSVMYLNKGQYTTCNYAHPHFAINFTKSKLIANEKIFTGPAYVTIEDVPTPLALPFAYFPLAHDRASGILLPSYGWMTGRGYYLKDGGYYFAINDFLDLALIGELYTNLSWAAEAKSNYYKRYKYKGNFDIRYGITKTGIRGDTNTYRRYGDFKVAWRHDQDAKANPNSRFSANVNLISRNYNRNTTNSADYFNSTTTSSISYSTSLGSWFNLALSARESYNIQTGLMNIQLPSLSLSSNTFYPLRRKIPAGAYRWYENISMSYVLEGANNVNAQDTDIFKKTILNNMQYGISQRIPLQSSVKVLKYFNWTNSATYNERWHWSTINKDIDSTGRMVIDTIRGFRANRDITFNSSLSTRIYGMFNFKYGPLKALRHVVNPTLSFNYRPNFGSEKLGYWKSYTDTTGYVHRYSIFEQSLYGGPADGRSGQIGFSIANNLEAKIKPLRDTVDELKKIKLIENLTLSMNYDLARDSLNWSNLNVSGRTTLFKSLVLNYSGSFSPYEIDSLGNKHDIFLWKTKNKLFQLSQSTWSAQLSWSLNNNTFKKEAVKDNGKMVSPILQTPDDYSPALMMGTYADFSVPWNISLHYTMSYVSAYDAAKYNIKNTLTHSVSISGNFSLTENWKFNFSTGYDFTNKGMSYTSIDIYRDLHCWEMRFNWVPFGYYKSWNFAINIKASSLRDVKYEKRENYQSNQGYYIN